MINEALYLLGSQHLDPARRQLESVSRVSGIWIRGLEPGDAHRSRLLAMTTFIQQCIGVGDYSSDNMEAVQSIVCASCDHLQPGLSALCSRKRGLEGCWFLGLLV
jgi:hypothetical protein